MAMLLFVESMFWSIIGDVGFVVSSVVLATQALLSFHILTGKMETRPSTTLRSTTMAEYWCGPEKRIRQLFLPPHNLFSRPYGKKTTLLRWRPLPYRLRRP